MAKVYIILLNWNGWKDTIQCLESVLRSSYPDFRVIVCDNGSTDGSLQRIKDWAEGRWAAEEPLDEALKPLIAPPIKKPLAYVQYREEDAEKGGEQDDEKPPLVLIQNNTNKGFSGGNNPGLRYAMQKNAEYLWLLNNDTLAAASALKELVYRMQSDDSLGLAGALIYHASEPGEIQAYGGGKLMPLLGLDRLVHSPGALDYISGTSLFIRRRVIEEIGLLDEEIFFYWEDVDYCQRAIRSGWKLGVASNAVVYHKFSASVGEQSLKSDRFKAASLTRYFKKYYRLRWMIPVGFNIGGMVVKRLFRRQFNRIKPILKETLNAVKSRFPSN
jgi:GT2 family glycosyltransferase